MRFNSLLTLLALLTLALAAGCQHNDANSAATAPGPGGAPVAPVSHPPGPGGLPAGAPHGPNGEPASLDREMQKARGGK